MFLGRTLRTRLDIIKPSVKNVVEMKQYQSRQTCGGRKEWRFNVDDLVSVETFAQTPRWVPGKIVKKLTPTSYLINVGQNRVWRRHVDSIIARTTSDEDGTIEQNTDDFTIGPEATSTDSRRQSNRVRRPPNRPTY